MSIFKDIDNILAIISTGCPQPAAIASSVDSSKQPKIRMPTLKNNLPIFEYTVGDLYDLLYEDYWKLIFSKSNLLI